MLCIHVDVFDVAAAFDVCSMQAQLNGSEYVREW